MSKKNTGAIATIENAHVEDAYTFWAPIYDFVFTWVMAPGRKAAVAVCSRPGRRVLDVGVGTGLELPMFESRTRIVGVDLSEPMLRRAENRVRREGLRHVEGLVKMDATRLAFADGVFDCAVAPYVLTVVPDPHATLDELARVVKRGGDIVLVNHVGATSGPIAWIEKLLARWSHTLGWRPDFPWEVLGAWIDKRPDVELVERRRLSPLCLFTLAHLQKK